MGVEIGRFWNKILNFVPILLGNLARYLQTEKTLVKNDKNYRSKNEKYENCKIVGCSNCNLVCDFFGVGAGYTAPYIG